MSRLHVVLAVPLVAAATLVMSGCGRQAISQYAVRDHELVFVQVKGTSWSLGDCKRASDGSLSDCKSYPVVYK